MSNSNNTAYNVLSEKIQEISLLSSVNSILYWDTETQAPEGSKEYRGKQHAALGVLVQKMMKDPSVGDLISSANNENLSTVQRRNVDLINYNYQCSTLVPESLTKELNIAKIQSNQAWAEARAKSDFSIFKPHLEKIFDLEKKKAEYIQSIRGYGLYDTRIDSFQEGLNQEIIDPIFARLKSFLPDFIQTVIEKQKQRPILPIEGPFPAAKQKQLGQDLMKTLGFDFDRGRLDISTHPFCGGIPQDVRMTTRYDENDFSSGLMGILHETGHGLYEQGLPKDIIDEPIGESLGMSVHESQSLFVEMQISRSPAFLKHVHGLAKGIFNGSGDAWAFDNFLANYHVVKRDFVRVNADEVTYPLHVILRYEIEQALFNGDLKIADIPGVWNEKMQAYLGITPENDAMGCLQDVHWCEGLFGYFPSYTMGAIIAAQLEAAMRSTMPNYEAKLEKGDFSDVLAWLRTNIHTQASTKTFKELVQSATGSDLSVEPFISHVQKRYLG